MNTLFIVIGVVLAVIIVCSFIGMCESVFNPVGFILTIITSGMAIIFIPRFLSRFNALNIYISGFEYGVKIGFMIDIVCFFVYTVFCFIRFEYGKKLDVKLKKKQEMEANFVLHVKYENPIEENKKQIETTSIMFSRLRALQHYIIGDYAYDCHNAYVKRTDNEILLYAENKVTGEKIWSAEDAVNAESLFNIRKRRYK